MLLQTKNSPESLIHNVDLETIYKIGSSISGPITRAIEINSCPGNEFIAIARANGEFLASVVMVRLAYSEYVKLIFSEIKRSIIALAVKKMIRGMNIVTTVLRLSRSTFP